MVVNFVETLRSFMELVMELILHYLATKFVEQSLILYCLHLKNMLGMSIEHERLRIRCHVSSGGHSARKGHTRGK